MNPLASLALTVKELEPGEFHWIWLNETVSSDDLLSYSVHTISVPYANAAAAWSAGYLAIRAVLRGSPF
jgi:hypothetical protein